MNDETQKTRLWPRNFSLFLASVAAIGALFAGLFLLMLFMTWISGRQMFPKPYDPPFQESTSIIGATK